MTTVLYAVVAEALLTQVHDGNVSTSCPLGVVGASIQGADQLNQYLLAGLHSFRPELGDLPGDGDVVVMAFIILQDDNDGDDPTWIGDPSRKWKPPFRGELYNFCWRLALEYDILTLLITEVGKALAQAKVGTLEHSTLDFTLDMLWNKLDAVNTLWSWSHCSLYGDSPAKL